MINFQIIDSQEKLDIFIKKLARVRAFVFNTETTGLDPFELKLLGISFCFKEGEAYYFDFRFSISDFRFSNSNFQKLKEIFENPKIEKYGHDLKYDIKVLQANGINLAGVSFDTMIAAYLLNPGTRAYDLDFLVSNFLSRKIMPLEALIGTGRKKIPLENVPVQSFARYSAERAEATWELVQKLKKELQKANLFKLFSKIEMPLIPVLAQMELDGVKIDLGVIEKLKEKVQNRVQFVASKIYKIAGVKFNLDSPLQLREVLFEKLKIKTDGLGWGKTGISTAASELIKLRGTHPIIDLILEYRELAKLKSTYLDALPKLVHPKTGRIHTTFNQAITATGRLSSSNPNLQNIPTFGPGKMVRNAFVAPPGFKILSADYAHIELRIIASLANDKKMIEAFKKGEDIHTRTASLLWGIAPEKVTPEIRRAAKSINFGVTYGMGPKALALGAGISYKQAKEFIERYFKIFSGIKKFIEKAKEEAQDKGYAESFFGRRRYLPEIDSPIPEIRAAALRMAVNMPIQATAADIMKLAMIAVADGLPKISPSSKMILQVHDELVFEVPENDVKKVAKFVKEAMENVVKLKVPIVAEVEIGDSWGTMEKLQITNHKSQITNKWVHKF